MSQALLLKIVRESITEVFEAQHTIDKKQLIKEHPVLAEPLASFVCIYIDNKLKAQAGSIKVSSSLLEGIIRHAKQAAFDNTMCGPLMLSEYLRASIELSLLTPAQELRYSTPEQIKKQVRINKDGLCIIFKEKETSLLPQMWSFFPSFELFFSQLLQQAGLNESDLSSHPKLYIFQVQKQRDEPILK